MRTLIAAFLALTFAGVARAADLAAEQRIEALKKAIVDYNAKDPKMADWLDLDCGDGIQVIGFQVACQNLNAHVPPGVKEWHTIFNEQTLMNATKEFEFSPWGHDQYLLYRPQIPPIPDSSSPSQAKALERRAEITRDQMIEAVRRAQRDARAKKRMALALPGADPFQNL